MTEEEAKTKWCPFVRIPFYATSGALTVNRRVDGTADSSCKCLGSDCMAWRTYNKGKSGFCGLATNLYTAGTI